MIEILSKRLNRWYRKHSGQWDGQDAYAYGYASIVQVEAYLRDRYGRSSQLTQLAHHELPLEYGAMKEVTDDERSCTLVAAARIGAYYNHITMKEMYAQVKQVAKKYLYSPKIGTLPFFIKGILKHLLPASKVQEAHSRYVWNFPFIKRVLDRNNPLIMSIARGFYGNHSITVTGYEIWRVDNRIVNFLIVADGWKSAPRYLDFTAFERDMKAGAICNFVWIETPQNKQAPQAQ